MGVLTFVTREFFVLFDGFTVPPEATEQWVDAGLEKFSKMRVRSRLIPAMSGCDWKTDVLDLAGKSRDDACPTVRRSPSCFTYRARRRDLQARALTCVAAPCRRGCSSRRVRNLARFLAVPRLLGAWRVFIATKVRLEPGLCRGLGLLSWGWGSSTDTAALPGR